MGPAKHMTGILMGDETQDSHGKPFVLVVQDVSVYDPAMSDSLIPVGRLIEAGFMVNHRIPSHLRPTRMDFFSKLFRCTLAPSRRLTLRQ